MTILSDFCAAEGCERLREPAPGGRRKYCVGHNWRWRKYRDVRAHIPIRPQHAPGRPDVWCSYAAAHLRVTKARGKASEHLCVDCTHPAQEWSYAGGAVHEFTGPSRGSMVRYSGDPADYEPRCRPCHKDHDRDQRNRQAVS